MKDLEIVKTDDELQQFPLTKTKGKKLKRMTKAEKNLIVKDLKKQLDDAIKERRFEDAAMIRDQIKEIE